MMSNNKNFLKKVNNERGVALMMILTSIIILTAIYSQFTFESKISRIKAINIIDRSQSKLLAEAGLQLAMTRLRLYKEAYNKIQGNKDAAKLVTPQLLNQLWEVPFIYPIPVAANGSQIFKETVNKFETESLLDGQMKVSIQNISSRLNLNLLRIDVNKLKVDDNGNVNLPETTAMLTQGNERNDEVTMDKALYQLMKRMVDEKKDKDETFADRYGNLNYLELFTNLKYYISDYMIMNTDPMVAEAESNFAKIPLTPKFGPLASASELYAVPGWNDELVDLIKNEFSVYPTMQIDLNKITANMLRLLVPGLDDGEIAQFFKWRDDAENPKQLNSIEDLKKYIVETLRATSETDFNNRIQAFQKSGITFGANPNLFKIVAEGEYNRSIYTLVAYVVLPTQEQLTQTPPPVDTDGDGIPDKPQPPATQPGTTPQSGSNQPPKQNAQLLEPRIIEMQIN